MLDDILNRPGSLKLNNPIAYAILIIIAVISGILIAKGGLITAIMITAILPILIYLNRFFVITEVPFISLLFMSFFAIGLTRYVRGVPLGLSIDGLLVISYLAMFFKHFYEKLDYKRIRIDLVLFMVIWFVYALLQLVNPEALSKQAWFYAMRGMSLYPLLTIPLIILMFNKYKYFNLYLYLWGILSIIGTMKGWMQLYVGVDFAEQRWLDEVGGVTHMLWGQLRVFSFYSDAGQFGAAQAHAGVVGTILAASSKSMRDKIFFGIMAITGFWGMMISGTRGAMIIPLLGFAIYIVLRKNMRVMIIGGVLLVFMFVFFKFTTIGQSNYQIQRMRTAFNPEEDASLQVRLTNQRILKVYLETRKFGGGIGSAGLWGERFSPQGFLAQIATDSWYVQIWAEQGIVGLMMHLFFLSYILIKCSYIVMFKIKDKLLIGKMSAIIAGFVGIMGSSYGNGVLGQIPTGIIMYIGWAYMFMARELDDEIASTKKLLSAIPKKSIFSNQFVNK